MLTLNDPIEKDVLKAVFDASQMRLQRFKIRDQLRSKYEKQYAEGSFDVVLQRRLDSLCARDLLKKVYVERRAFYFIPNNAKDKIKLLMEKREIKKKIDQIPPEFLQELNRFLDSLVKGEEFWVWPQGIHHSKKIIKYKAEKKILRQD